MIDALFRQPLWRYCLLAYPLCLLPGAGLLMAVTGLLMWMGVDVELLLPTQKKTTPWSVFSSVIMAPAAETVLMGWGLMALQKLTQRQSLVIGASGALWGCAHAVWGVMWFFAPAWAFIWFSAGWLHWRQISKRAAFLAAFIPHALVNATVEVLVFVWDV